MILVPILVISLAIIAITLFAFHIYYYKLSGKENRVIQFRWLYGGWIILAKVFFPISIKFKDDLSTRHYKRMSNNLLYAFYVCFLVAIIVGVMFLK